MRLKLFKNEKIPFIFILVVLGISVVKLSLFINKYSVDIPFADQWNYFPALWSGIGNLDKFYFQLGPHRMGLSLVIDSLILSFTGWNVRALAFISGVYLVLAAIFALKLKRRLFGTFYYTDIFIPIVILSLAQYETLVVDPFPAYAPFPLFLLFLYSNAWFIKNTTLKYVSIILLNFLLVFSGFGYFILLPTFVVFVHDLRYAKNSGDKAAFQRSLLAILFLIITTALFFVNFDLRFYPTCFQFPHKPLTDYITYIFLIYANFFGFGPLNWPHLTFFVGIFTFFVLCLAFLKSYWPKATVTPLTKITMTLIGFSFPFAILASLGRVCKGLDASFRSAYIAYLIPAFIGIYFLITASHHKNLKKIVAIGLVISVLLAEQMILKRDRELIEHFKYSRETWISCYKRVEDIGYCSNYANFSLMWTEFSFEDTKVWLDYMKDKKYSFYSNHH